MKTLSPADMPSASYHRVDIDNLRLEQRSSRSFTTADMPSLEAYLLKAHYIAERTRSSVEYGRYRRGPRLICLFHSGSISCQGDDWEGAVRELGRFVREGGAL